MIKGIVATDLDGTLLYEERYSSFTRSVLQRVQKEGYLVLLASGRPCRSILPIYQDLGCDGPIIGYNGGIASFPFDPTKPSWEKRFAKATIQAIHEEARRVYENFVCESAEVLYADEPEGELDKYFPSNGMATVYGDVPSLLKEDPFTCLFRCPMEKQDQLRDICNAHPDVLWRSWTDSVYSELAIPGVNKGTALLFLAEHLGIPFEHVIAFGDADNDVEMLSVAGTAFAMKDCRSSMIKERFRQTKYTAQEDGVARELVDLLNLI